MFFGMSQVFKKKKIKKKGKINGNQVPELVKLQSMEQIL